MVSDRKTNSADTTRWSHSDGPTPNACRTPEVHSVDPRLERTVQTKSANQPLLRTD